MDAPQCHRGAMPLTVAVRLQPTEPAVQRKGVALATVEFPLIPQSDTHRTRPVSA
ncbi:hypothetical protein SBV1_3360004 [Verrucomicrobia bacterium]|nr:hypothetical protein SBV1_3360004 [Verrucomicrobiota bacterium]